MIGSHMQSAQSRSGYMNEEAAKEEFDYMYGGFGSRADRIPLPMNNVNRDIADRLNAVVQCAPIFRNGSKANDDVDWLFIESENWKFLKDDENWIKYIKLRNATVSMTADYKSKENEFITLSFEGTAFFVDSNTLITAGHNVRKCHCMDPNIDEITENNAELAYEYHTRFAALSCDDTACWEHHGKFINDPKKEMKLQPLYLYSLKICVLHSTFCASKFFEDPPTSFDIDINNIKFSNTNRGFGWQFKDDIAIISCKNNLCHHPYYVPFECDANNKFNINEISKVLLIGYPGISTVIPREFYPAYPTIPGIRNVIKGQKLIDFFGKNALKDIECSILGDVIDIIPTYLATTMNANLPSLLRASGSIVIGIQNDKLTDGIGVFVGGDVTKSTLHTCYHPFIKKWNSDKQEL